MYPVFGSDETTFVLVKPSLMGGEPEGSGPWLNPAVRCRCAALGGRPLAGPSSFREQTTLGGWACHYRPGLCENQRQTCPSQQAGPGR
jgi:hypothetical protein